MYLLELWFSPGICPRMGLLRSYGSSVFIFFKGTKQNTLDFSIRTGMMLVSVSPVRPHLLAQTLALSSREIDIGSMNEYVNEQMLLAERTICSSGSGGLCTHCPFRASGD